MSNNCHVINFQNLKKFFTKISTNQKMSSSSYNRNHIKVDDSRVFGSAYHKILEQNETIIKKLAKSQSISELNPVIENYNLTAIEKNILLQMVRKIYSHNFYKNAICTAKYIHKEQKLCHFFTKNQYVFRLEAIIDGILSMNGRHQIIIDYKTVNSVHFIEKHIHENFYWMQLLFYKYIYENCLKDNQKIFDCILFFQSKNKHDDYEIIIKKFSDLPKRIQDEYEENFHNGLQKYTEHYCKYGRHEKETNISSSVKNGVKLERKKKVRLFGKNNGLKITIKSSITAIVGAILFLFEKSQDLIGDEKIIFFVLIFFGLVSLWFIFRE